MFSFLAPARYRPASVNRVVHTGCAVGLRPTVTGIAPRTRAVAPGVHASATTAPNRLRLPRSSAIPSRRFDRAAAGDGVSHRRSQRAPRHTRPVWQVFAPLLLLF